MRTSKEERHGAVVGAEDFGRIRRKREGGREEIADHGRDQGGVTRTTAKARSGKVISH